MLVAQTAAAPFGHEHALSGRAQVGQKRFLFAFDRTVHERAGRNRNHQIRPAAPRLVRRAAALAGFGCETALVTELDQRRKLGRRFEIDAAAVSAVAARGTALGNVLLAPPSDEAVAAVSRGRADGGFVDELHFSPNILAK